VPKRIAILGSTGSIGRSTLEVINHLGGDFRAIALSAGTGRRANCWIKFASTDRPRSR
jgi:1-deoxy-D-xylulose 5-phosphate reductoisomerase